MIVDTARPTGSRSESGNWRPAGRVLVHREGQDLTEPRHGTVVVRRGDDPAERRQFANEVEHHQTAQPPSTQMFWPVI